VNLGTRGGFLMHRGHHGDRDDGRGGMPVRRGKIWNRGGGKWVVWTAKPTTGMARAVEQGRGGKIAGGVRFAGTTVNIPGVVSSNVR